MPFTCMPGTVVAGLAPRLRADLGDIPWLDAQFDGQGRLTFRPGWRLLCTRRGNLPDGKGGCDLHLWLPCGSATRGIRTRLKASTLTLYFGAR